MQKIRNGETRDRRHGPGHRCKDLLRHGGCRLRLHLDRDAARGPSVWEQVARMWATCPGGAVPGGPYPTRGGGETSQKPTDMGALVVIIPTVDSVEEARRAVDWTYFPPMGRRSNGGGPGFSGPGCGGQVSGAATAPPGNENVVLILMIETLEGVQNAAEIAGVPGVDGLFAASGDLGKLLGLLRGGTRSTRCSWTRWPMPRSAPAKSPVGLFAGWASRPRVLPAFQGGDGGGQYPARRRCGDPGSS